MARPKPPQARQLARRFGDNQIVLRNRAEQSQETTSRRSGLHRSQISLLERGLRLPQLDTILRVAGALEVEPYELLAGMEWQIDRAALEDGDPESFVGSYAPQEVV
jgi:transcriptional regulator with XRE-family HTH domain